MNEPSKFPKELLKRHWKERLDYFHGCKVPHERMAAVCTDIKNAIRRRAGQGFIFVVGPTRIGKTTALDYVVNSLLAESMDEMLKDPGCIPVAKMEACAYHRGYDWKDHWIGCLEALKEPLIEYKSEHPLFDSGRPARVFIRERKSGTLMRRSFEEAARQRKLRVFCLDEAQHLTLVPSSTMYRAQVEIIKSVASQSKAMHVLFGTYDLLKLRNASGQLGSRAVTVHFDRYRHNIKTDIEAFADAVLSLTAYMPLREKPDFSGEDLDYCFEVSLGCIGLLKVWLADALGAVLEKGRNTLSRKDLEKHEPPLDVLDKVSLEICDGEARLRQDEQKRDLIRLRMRGVRELTPPPLISEGRQSLTDSVDPLNDPSSPERTPRKRSKSKKIERKPKRDGVGQGRRKKEAA